MWAKQKQYGFTIVELLIVIVVIAILAATSVTAFSGVQTRAQNTARYNEIKAWKKQFELYRAQYGNLPTVADGGMCLGSGFPTSSTSGNVPRCRDYTSTGAVSYLESNNAALMTELLKVGSLPNSQRVPINGTVGPYLIAGGNEIHLMLILRGGSSDCPADTGYNWSDGNGLLICRYVLTK